MNQYRPLGELLVSHNLISVDQLESILQLQNTTSKRIGQLVVEHGLVKEEDVSQCIAIQFGLDYLSPTSLRPTVGALSYFTASKAREKMMLPLEFQRGRLLCAIVDPVDVKSTDEVSQEIGIPLDFIITSPTGLLRAIAMAYEEPLLGSPSGYSPNPGINPTFDNQSNQTQQQASHLQVVQGNNEDERTPEAFFAAIARNSGTSPVAKPDEIEIPLKVVSNELQAEQDADFTKPEVIESGANPPSETLAAANTSPEDASNLNFEVQPESNEQILGDPLQEAMPQMADLEIDWKLPIEPIQYEKQVAEPPTSVTVILAEVQKKAKRKHPVRPQKDRIQLIDEYEKAMQKLAKQGVA